MVEIVVIMQVKLKLQIHMLTAMKIQMQILRLMVCAESGGNYLGAGCNSYSLVIACQIVRCVMVITICPGGPDEVGCTMTCSDTTCGY